MFSQTKKYVLIFLIPSLILISTFVYYPLFSTIFYSFYNWRDFSNFRKFIGLGNYERLIKDVAVHKAIINTFIMLITVILFQVGFALILALMVHYLQKGYKFFRTVYFFPVTISGTAIGLMFYLAYGYEYGFLNSILTFFGKDKIIWITENSALFMVLIPIIWQYVGFYFVIFLAALSKIPQDFYDSALIDGASKIYSAVYISIPLIWDVIAVSLSLAIVGTFKVFDIVYVITGGGPMNASQVLGTYLHSVAFTGQNQGYGSAIGTLIIFLGLLLSVITNKFLKRDRITY